MISQWKSRWLSVTAQNLRRMCAKCHHAQASNELVFHFWWSLASNLTKNQTKDAVFQWCLQEMVHVSLLHKLVLLNSFDPFNSFFSCSSQFLENFLGLLFIGKTFSPLLDKSLSAESKEESQKDHYKHSNCAVGINKSFSISSLLNNYSM